MNRRVDGLWCNLNDAKDRISCLIKNIKSGKDSLGNKFDDFVFCAVGANPYAWKPFYELDERIRNSEGQELLVVDSKTEPCEPMIRYASHGPGQFGFVGPEPGPSKASFMPPRVLESIKYDWSYGVLTGKDLDFDLENGELIFPSGRTHLHISTGSVFCSNLVEKVVEKVRGRIRKQVFELPHLSHSYVDPFLELLHPSEFGSRNSKVLVGPEVGTYFDKFTNGDSVYSEMKKRL
jgi:hypothetical protein